MRNIGGILFLSALVAAGWFVYNQRHETSGRSQLAKRLENLESRLEQEVAVRRLLLKDRAAGTTWSSAPAPTPTLAPAPSVAQPAQEPPKDLRQEIEEKNRQIQYLRSVVERMAADGITQPQAAYGSRQMTVEDAPRPIPVMPVPTPTPSSDARPVNQVLGEVTQIDPNYTFMFINRGQRHGVTNGMEFEVYRRGTLQGRIRVGILYEEVCSVLSTDGSGLQTFQKGDMVRSSPPASG